MRSSQRGPWVRITIRADELERVIERLNSELARARARSSGRTAIVPPQRGYAVTVVAAAIGVAAALVPFVVGPAPAPRAPPAAAATVTRAQDVPPIVIAPAPTLPLPVVPARPRDPSYLRSL